MDFSLTEEQRAWQAKARKFAAEEIRPRSLARDRIADPAATFDWDLIKRGSALGFRTSAVPREWGGHGIDFVTQVVVMAELARGDSAMSKAFSQCWKWSHLIATQCNEEQKQRFLKPFLEDDTFVLGRGSTEPNGGSDNRLPPEDDPRAGLRLQAERRGDEWILNGEKTFIANGNIAKLLFVDARTDPAKPLRQGTTMFMIPKDTPGFRVGKVFNKRGWRFYQNAELIFENARVPHVNVVGDVNGAGKSKARSESWMKADMFSDLELAANATGVCDAACDQAMDYVRTRKQGGRPLIEQQQIMLKINKMRMLTEALRTYVLRAAWENDRQIESSNANSSLAMNFSCDVIQEVTELNMDIHGAARGRMDELAEKLVRDSMIWSHLAGDTVQRLAVVKRDLANGQRTWH